MISGNIKVGDPIYLIPVNSRYKGSRIEDIVEDEVVKVGRKYVYTLKKGLKFYLDSGAEYTEYSANYRAYSNKLKLESVITKGQLVESVFRRVSKHSLSLLPIRILRSINDKLDEYEKNKDLFTTKP